ncbi:hypothetical protein CPC08DRAFT_433154 [Agrocybe pediades]|nr:hypothetical protein CPC08DRAFT_433154 [Agrocybe pediades]
MTGAGKSFFVNAATDGRNAAAISSSLTSCTAPPNIFRLAQPVIGIPVYIADTRGFDDTSSSTTDKDVWEEITSRLAASRAENPKRLCGVIYLTSFQSGRLQHSDSKNLSNFLTLYGDDVCRKVVFATNRGTQKQHDELKRKFPWYAMINKGSQIARFSGDRASAMATVETVVRRLVADQRGIEGNEQNIAQELEKLGSSEQKESEERQSGWKKLFSKLRFWK